MFPLFTVRNILGSCGQFQTRNYLKIHLPKISIPKKERERRIKMASNRDCKFATEGDGGSVKSLKWRSGLRRSGAVGFKLGMLTHYDEWGRRHPTTVIRLDSCQVLRSFPVGDAIIQEVGAGLKSMRNLHHAQRNLFEECGVQPKLTIHGFEVSKSALLPPGTIIHAAHFLPGQFVDVKAKSIGKGFQGAMVRWGFKGMPASHGVSVVHRHLGATGSRTDPGRVLKGKKMAGRMGGKWVTVKSLKILKIDNVLNCLFVRGSVPGHKNSIVRIRDSWRNPIFETTPPPYPTYIPTKESTPLPRVMLAAGSEKDTLHIESIE